MITPQPHMRPKSSYRVEPHNEVPSVTTYEEVQHRPSMWVRARVDRRCRYQGAGKVAVYYFVDAVQSF